MVKTEPDIVSTEKRIQHKRNRLFLTGCILLLLAGFVWIFSWMQQFELDTLHAMAINKPVNLSLGSGASIEGGFVTIGGVIEKYLSYSIPFLVALAVVVVGIAIMQSEASYLIIIAPVAGVIFSTIILTHDEPKSLPSATSVRTEILIPAGEVNELISAITTEYPGAGLILKNAMEKGGNDTNVAAALEGEMRSGYAAGDARRAMNISVALVQALTVAAQDTSDEKEANMLQDRASRVAALSVRIMKDYNLVNKELAYRLYELAQRLEPSIVNDAKPAIDVKYQESAEIAGILRTLKSVFLMMAMILITLSGFANRNLRVLKQLRTQP
ncbi:hypothetical protein [Providencia rettgeri]|uniref:hypothetical protein n=1 Tax=Providencia rettgeri TaxID=587 RepID=UPI001181CC1B|nr:hypothetical protein [Providencia rettgeri]